MCDRDKERLENEKEGYGERSIYIKLCVYRLKCESEGAVKRFVEIERGVLR